MENKQTKIGKHIVDILTQSMYEDSRFIYREYVQNSADSIDKAIKEGLLKKEEFEIHIKIDRTHKIIVIEDNALGIEEDKVVDIFPVYKPRIFIHTLC
jgi:molecular chaperone HtpG